MSTDLKSTCHECGGHISYPEHAKGVTVNCPHCGKTTSLGKVHPTAEPTSPNPSPRPPSQPIPSKTKASNAGLVVGLFVVGTVVLVALLCSAPVKWKQQRQVARTEAAGAVQPPTPAVSAISPDVELVYSLLKPETTRLPDGFAYKWRWMSDGIQTAINAAKDAKKRGLIVGDPALETPYALVLYSRRIHSLPETPDMDLLEVEFEIGAKSGEPRSWQLYTDDSPSGKCLAQNRFGAAVMVTKLHRTSHWFHNMDTTTYPAFGRSYDVYEINSGDWRYSSIDNDLAERMYPPRGADGVRLAQQNQADGKPKNAIYALFNISPKTKTSEELDEYTKNLEVVMFFKLAPPFVESSDISETVQRLARSPHEEATFDKPEVVTTSSYFTLSGRVFAACFFDSRDGKTLARFDLAKNSTSQQPNGLNSPSKNILV